MPLIIENDLSAHICSLEIWCTNIRCDVQRCTGMRFIMKNLLRLTYNSASALGTGVIAVTTFILAHTGSVYTGTSGIRPITSHTSLLLSSLNSYRGSTIHVPSNVRSLTTKESGSDSDEAWEKEIKATEQEPEVITRLDSTPYYEQPKRDNVFEKIKEEATSNTKPSIEDIIKNGISLDDPRYNHTTSGSASSSDRQEREDFILSKIIDVYPHFKGKTYKDVVRLVSTSRLFSDFFSKIVDEWRNVSDQPLYMKDLVDESLYPSIREANLSLKSATAEYSNRIDQISQIATRKRQQAYEAYTERISEIGSRNEHAWVMSLQPSDLPIGLAYDLLDKFPPIEGEVVDVDGISTKKLDADELTKLKLDRRHKIDQYMVRFKRWLIITGDEYGMSYRKLFNKVSMDMGFRIQ